MEKHKGTEQGTGTDTVYNADTFRARFLFKSQIFKYAAKHNLCILSIRDAGDGYTFVARFAHND